MEVYKPDCEHTPYIIFHICICSIVVDVHCIYVYYFPNPYLNEVNGANGGTIRQMTAHAQVAPECTTWAQWQAHAHQPPVHVVPKTHTGGRGTLSSKLMKYLALLLASIRWQPRMTLPPTCRLPRNNWPSCRLPSGDPAPLLATLTPLVTRLRDPEAAPRRQVSPVYIGTGPAFGGSQPALWRGWQLARGPAMWHWTHASLRPRIAQPLYLFSCRRKNPASGYGDAPCAAALQPGSGARCRPGPSGCRGGHQHCQDSSAAATAYPTGAV